MDLHRILLILLVFLTIFLLLAHISTLQAQPIAERADNDILTEHYGGTEAILSVDDYYAQELETNHAVGSNTLYQTFEVLGILIFGIILLRFLKLKVLVLIIGLLVIIYLNANAQPGNTQVPNDAYFGKSTMDYGPVTNDYMAFGPAPGANENVPIDNGILFLLVGGLGIGTFYIWRHKQAF